MQIDLIVNPCAHLYRRERRLLERVRKVARGRVRLHVTGSLTELREACEELARRGTDVVALSGGDGTLMAGVTALRAAFGEADLPAIAPLPGGTAGTVARNWGIAGDPAAALARLLQGGLGRRQRRPSLLVEQWAAGAPAPALQQVGFIFGTGLVASFFQLYYERGAPGYSGAAKLVARIFVESFVSGPIARRVLEPLPCKLVVDGQLMPPDAWSLICCSVVQNLGIHMIVNYRAAEDHQRPHLVATPMKVPQLGPRAPLVLAGKPIGGPGHVDALVESLAVRFAGKGPYVLDGELLDAHEVAVRAGPQLTIVTP